MEICTGKSQPHCVHHSFVLQQDSSHTLYGIALRVWSRADEKRAETIRDLRKKTESDYYDNPDETYWIPYCLSFLSRYPLYDLLGDYLRGMWIHWNKATNLFHAEEVSRILSFPAPRLNDLVRIDMKDYALCYQFPSSPTGFQNFSMWPLFNCLSIPNIVGVIEAAVSPTRRIIFVSHYPAMLTIAAETIRFCIRVYEWSGLYVPVVHARHAKELVEEPGPYILGISPECRSLFTAPSDALVVDLDRNFVLTSIPPNVLTPGQRTKFINRLTQALNGEVTPSGVPQHLRSAYGGGKLIPAGQIIVMKGEVESVQDPAWWNQDAVMSVTDHVCEKLVSLIETLDLRTRLIRTGTQYWRKSHLWRLREEAAYDEGFYETLERNCPRAQPILARHCRSLARLHQPQGTHGYRIIQSHQAQQFLGRRTGDLEAAGKIRLGFQFVLIILTMCSSSNSKRLLSSLPRRPLSSRSRLKGTSVRIADLLASSTRKRMILLVLLFVFLALRSNVTMLWRPWFFSKRSPRSLSANVSATRRSSQLWSTEPRLLLVNAMRLRESWCTCAA